MHKIKTDPTPPEYQVNLFSKNNLEIFIIPLILVIPFTYGVVKWSNRTKDRWIWRQSHYMTKKYNNRYCFKLFFKSVCFFVSQKNHYLKVLRNTPKEKGDRSKVCPPNNFLTNNKPKLSTIQLTHKRINNHIRAL